MRRPRREASDHGTDWNGTRNSLTPTTPIREDSLAEGEGFEPSVSHRGGASGELERGVRKVVVPLRGTEGSNPFPSASESVSRRITELAALVDRPRRLGCGMTWDTAGKAELAEQPAHALGVLRDAVVSASSVTIRASISALSGRRPATAARFSGRRTRLPGTNRCGFLYGRGGQRTLTRASPRPETGYGLGEIRSRSWRLMQGNHRRREGPRAGWLSPYSGRRN